jgi:Big-like domain-containing protein
VSTPVLIDVLANDSDPDGDPLTIISVTQPANGAATITNGEISYQPQRGFTGTVTFQYTISDGRGGTATATVTVVVG